MTLTQIPTIWSMKSCYSKLNGYKDPITDSISIKFKSLMECLYELNKRTDILERKILPVY
jgi:hypothetical protein